MKLTESILRQGGEELTSKLGTEEIIIPFKELVKYDLSIRTLYYLETFCEMSREDIVDYYNYMEIENSKHVYESRNVKDCDTIRQCERVSNSRQIRASSDIFTCTDVISSTNVDWSTHIYRSDDVKNSDLIYNSEKVEYSSRIVVGHDITWCKDLLYCDKMRESVFDFHCEDCYNDYFSYFARQCKNCWFCLNIENCENYIFNKEATPAEVARLKELYYQYISDDWSQIIKQRTSISGYTINPTFSKHQIDSSFINVIKNLPQFDAEILETILQI